MSERESRRVRRTFLAGLVALGVGSSGVGAAPPDAATILRRADRAVLGEAAAYTLRMTVVRPGKPERHRLPQPSIASDDQGGLAAEIEQRRAAGLEDEVVGDPAVLARIPAALRRRRPLRRPP